MPMIDKPENWCRDGMSELWDALSNFVDFVELFGYPDEEEEPCEDLPTNNEIEDAGCTMMCQIIYRSPIARCIIPLSPNSFLETPCID